MIQSKGLQQFNKKNSIQSPSNLLSGLTNKRNSSKNADFGRHNNDQSEESGSIHDSKFQFSSNAFSKFKNNSGWGYKQN